MANPIKWAKNLPAKLFGTRNDRVLKRYGRLADAAIAFQDELRALCSEGDDYDAAFEKRSAQIAKPTTQEPEAVAEYERQLQEIRLELSAPLRARSDEFRERLAAGASPDEHLPEGFAILREASRRAQRHRHFHCQLVGGSVLYDGQVAEMRTGEGKTIVCHLACYMKVAQGMKAHIVTVNDYLVKRDADFARPIFELLGITVGYIQSQVDPGGREGHRISQYACDVTYGTAAEFGFDYLRDNMKHQKEAQVQGRLDYVIIDEVDSILIDEARTPLIISGPAHDDVTRYPRANKVAEELVRRQDQWDRKVQSTVAKYDGDPRNIPKLDDAMRILGYRKSGEKNAVTEETQDGADGSTSADEQAPETGGDAAAMIAALGPDFLTDDQVEAIQIFENNVLQIPTDKQYRKYFIVQPERKQVGLTHEGVTIAQDLLDMGSLYAGANMEWPHLIENSLRAHKVYQRDRDYVVQNREVIIVDPFTGRLMHGRQWSDGLHQSVEAREGVPVKEETQTLATITIQNFFKLYKERAGMTGTAMTEATEFMKIYGLDVVEIPTNRPVNRLDHNDKMYQDVNAKYQAIVDEIHEIHRRGRPADPFLFAEALNALRPILESLDQDVARIDEAISRFHDAEPGDQACIRFMAEVYDESMGNLVRGRPVLVGTTSVENSEKLSRLLERRYGIEHEVLNAKNHAREAEIVMKAGHQAIPTQGADKTPIGNVTIATNMAGRGTDIKLGEQVVYPTCRVPEQLPDGAEPSSLYPVGITKCCITCEEYDEATNCAHCFKPKLDPRFPAMGRNVCSISAPCGLHIIGTERHEARRIDNQLRGRSGRQGDPGSSRFALSLEDDLLKLFLSDWMLKTIERFGFADGASLEDKRLTKGIERAQRKVEERNFSARKHLLEWDEPMDYQRKEFYRSRQLLLDRAYLGEIILDIIDTAIDSMLEQFLDPTYRQSCVAEWCRSNLDITIEKGKIDVEDIETAQHSIRREAVDEAHDQVRTVLGEYIDPEEDPKNWDVGGLAQWAQRTFKASFTQNQLRKMDPQDIEDELLEAARTSYEEANLDGVEIFLDREYPYHALAEWARSKFNIDLETEELLDTTRADIGAVIKERVRGAYHRREIEYPVESILEQAFSQEGTDNAMAAERVVRWVNSKYRANWTLADIQGKTFGELRDRLIGMNEEYLNNGKFDAEIQTALEKLGSEADAPEEVLAWGKTRLGAAWNPDVLEGREDDPVGALREMGRQMFRWELSMLERFVMLRIYDQAWKDHLLEMDHLKLAIMQRPLGGDQTHPQSQFAIEGRDLFEQMWARIANRVTDIIFKVKAYGGQTQQGQAGQQPSMASSSSGVDSVVMQHIDATGSGFGGRDRDQEAAMRAQGAEQVVETIRREQPRVGRNDACPCGSGKKFKHCHGKR
jgi:preprotein translocase subunit SecA